jgi:hypothetical protein
MTLIHDCLVAVQSLWVSADITLNDCFYREFIKVTTRIIFNFVNSVRIEPLGVFKLALEVVQVSQLDIEVLVFASQLAPVVSVDVASLFFRHLVVVVVVLLNFSLVCLKWVLFCQGLFDTFQTCFFENVDDLSLESFYLFIFDSWPLHCLQLLSYFLILSYFLGVSDHHGNIIPLSISLISGHRMPMFIIERLKCRQTRLLVKFERFNIVVQNPYEVLFGDAEKV